MKPKRDRRQVGLARALSKLGYCSRSQAAELIRAGRVALNGGARRNPESPVNLESDRIQVDGREIRAAGKIYLMLNKPRGVVTTADDEKGRATVYSLLPPDLPWVAPVARLDKASEGLLFLTNDSEWAARISAPESHVDKTYHVQIAAVPEGAALETVLKTMTRGVRDGGEFLRAKTVRLLRQGERNAWLEVVLDEGKNRQIRRILEHENLQVLRLVRVAVGSLSLGDLAKGAARVLTEREKAALGATARQR